jgi:hypothetical protein
VRYEFIFCPVQREDRVSITKKLNSKLCELCALYGVYFLDVFQDYANEDGSLKTELSDGLVHVHLSFNQPIMEKLFRILSIAP